MIPDGRPAPANLRLLIVEDDPADAELVCELLRDAGFDVDATVVRTHERLDAALQSDASFDAVLVDYTVPGLDGREVLDLSLRCCPDTPVIFVSGTIGEDKAVELLQQGATDYVLKDRMSRLPSAVSRALQHRTEVAARRRSEALYSLFAEHVSDVLWIVDMSTGRFSYVSPSVERMRGFTPEEALEQSFTEALTPEEAAHLALGLPKRIQEFYMGDPQAVSQIDRIDQPRKDGSIVHTEVVTTLTRDSHGALQLLGVSRDITGRVAAEEALDDYRENLERLVDERTAELEKASAAKSQFLANMSHELRTPLNSIIGYSEILCEGMAGDLTDQQKEYVGVVHSAGKHLLALINDILDLSKIEAARLEPRPEQFDAREAIEDTLKVLGPIAAGKSLPLASESPDEPVRLLTDRRMLTQILLNLTANAVKFTSEGSITVRLTASDGAVCFEIVDTGRGIAPEDMEEIFSDFGRGRAGRPETEGTGLGLTISRRLAALLGGALTVTSTLGDGSTFKLEIPARMPSA